MSKITHTMKRYFKIIKQVSPRNCFNNIEDGIEQILYEYLSDRGITTYPFNSKAFHGDTYSLENCLQAYEDGYNVIINDGKIVGYRKEAPAV